MKIDSKYLAVAFIVLVNAVIFTNSLYGDFVYDDNRQIVRNPLIQDPGLYTKALISDVWAFKGDGTVAASNYWRPTFTAFNILQFQAFGLNPVGWHAVNILLYIGVCVLAFLLLVRCGLSSYAAFAISLIFAVHPIHVESVAWIAGSPDLLFSLFLLASIWFAGNFSRSKSFLDLVFGIVLYGFAVGSKEVAILCFPLFWFVFTHESDAIAPKDKGRHAIRFVIPFALVAAAYFLARWVIIGQISHPVAGAIEFREAILTIPSAFIFYLKQILFPISLGINYSIRPVTSFGLVSFVLPFVISFAVLAVLVILAKRSFVQKLGFFIFLLPLLPVMNLTAFLPEQFVHDRYLFLPLLGFLMVFIPFIQEVAVRYARKNSEKFLSAVAIIVCLLLAGKTFAQNRVWASDMALWEHCTKVDPESSHNWAQFGAALLESGEFQKSVKAFDYSLDIKVSAIALMGRARVNLNLKRFEEAVSDLKTVTEITNEEINAYTLYQTYEALAITYSEQGNHGEAAKILIEARNRLPIYYAALTEKLAVVYYQTGKKELALRELEGAKTQSRVELLPESKTVLLRLGMLYAELGEKEKSLEVLQEYLKATSSLQDNLTLGDRKQANQILNQLNLE